MCSVIYKNKIMSLFRQSVWFTWWFLVRISFLFQDSSEDLHQKDCQWINIQSNTQAVLCHEWFKVFTTCLICHPLNFWSSIKSILTDILQSNQPMTANLCFMYRTIIPRLKLVIFISCSHGCWSEVNFLNCIKAVCILCWSSWFYYTKKAVHQHQFESLSRQQIQELVSWKMQLILQYQLCVFFHLFHFLKLHCQWFIYWFISVTLQWIWTSNLVFSWLFAVNW